jgi:hypothetical protein
MGGGLGGAAKPSEEGMVVMKEQRSNGMEKRRDSSKEGSGR